MPAEIFMPKLGLSMQEGTITTWLKKEGDPVKIGEVVAEITTDKIANTIEAQAAGTIQKLLYKEGDTALVGTVIAYIDENGNAKQETVEAADIDKTIAENTDGGKKIKQVIPLKGIRKVIAERMQESMNRSPQATATSRSDVTVLAAFRESCAKEGEKFSVTDLFVKIVAIALEKNPVLNSSLQDSKLYMYETINIGVAVAAENSLLVPVIKNVQDKSLSQISTEVTEIVRKAREGKLGSEDMTGGTFTISNLGMFNVDAMTPIINPPEAGILAIGPFHKEADFGDNDELQVKVKATLSFTFDHAVTDGVPAARFLETINDILKRPAEYLK